MPLKIIGSGVNARIHWCYPTWKVTIKSYGVVEALIKTHFGLPILRVNYDPPLEVVPGQILTLTRED